MGDVLTTTAARAALERLDFHDSAFRSIELLFSSGHARSCRLLIDYYDWEGNYARREADPQASWRWRSLEISFGYLGHFEYSAPDLLNRPQDIDRIEFDHRLEGLRAGEGWVRKTCSGYRSPLFDAEGGPLSVKFITQNSNADREGFVEVVGSDCRLRWDERPALVGQVHIPIVPDAEPGAAADDGGRKVFHASLARSPPPRLSWVVRRQGADE